MKFEPNKRTAYDASVSSGLALCAIQVEPNKPPEQKITMNKTPWRMYKVR